MLAAVAISKSEDSKPVAGCGWVSIEPGTSNGDTLQLDGEGTDTLPQLF